MKTEAKKILVVEDDEDIRYIVARTLKKMGYEAVSVGSGLEAIHAMTRQRFHLVLIDIEIPDMGAQQAVAEMRNCDPRIPLILMTRSPQRADTALLLAAKGCLYKPFTVDELRSMVRRVLGGASQEDP